MNDRPSDKTNLAKNALNKAAEICVSSQIDSAENLEIDIDSQPDRLLQGKVDSIGLKGREITWHELKIEELDLNLENLEIEILPTILGRVKLNKPGNIQAKIIVSETDCDRLLNSEYVITLLQKLPIVVNEQSYIWSLKNAKCYLGNDGELKMHSGIELSSDLETKTVDLEIEIQLCQQGREIIFKRAKYLHGKFLSLAMNVAMMTRIKDLLYLRHFNNSSFAFAIEQIEIANKQLILWSNIKVYQIPDSLKASIESVAAEINR
jgi:hypothetical protein